MLTAEKVREQAAQLLQRNEAYELQRASNCWNTTQRLFEPERPLEWEHGDYMEDWLAENTKTVTAKLDYSRGAAKADEFPPLTIVAFHDRVTWHMCAYRKATLLHTAVYLGNGEWFHKDGPGPFMFTDFYGLGYEGEYVQFHQLTESIRGEQLNLSY